MKKLLTAISLILALALFAAMAMGSGSNDSGNSQASSPVTSGGQSSSSKPSNSNNSGNSNASSKPQSSNSSPETSSSSKGITIEESILFDQGGIKITAKKIDTNGFFGPEITFLIENDSSDSITVQARKMSVNGYMIEPMMSADVAAGKKANASLTLTKTDLDLAGITTIADIELSFHIFDSESWDTILESDQIRIETSAAKDYNYKYDDSGLSVYNKNGIEIIAKGTSSKDSIFGPSLIIDIINSSNTDITVQVRDVSINGFMIDTIFSSDILAGKHSIDAVIFMNSSLEENGIDNIEDIELSFHIFNADTWNTIDDSEPIKLNIGQ